MSKDFSFRGTRGPKVKLKLRVVIVEAGKRLGS